MRAHILTWIALATSLSFGIAHAEEAKDMEVVVVTAARPDALQFSQVIAAEKIAPAIDFSKLSIEAPQLRPSKPELAPARIDVALQTDIDSQS